MRLVPVTAEDAPPQRILDFDVETVAAGFADPQWVPQKITCVAWSWIGSGEITSDDCGPMGLYYEPEKRADMLFTLLVLIAQADMVTGHNLLRFDLPVLNAEASIFTTTFSGSPLENVAAVTVSGMLTLECRQTTHIGEQESRSTPWTILPNLLDRDGLLAFSGIVMTVVRALPTELSAGSRPCAVT